MVHVEPGQKNESLVRDVHGEPMEGFSRDFIVSSIRATLLVPQTQSAICVSVAHSVLTAFCDGRGDEVLDLFFELSAWQRDLESINLDAVSLFVERQYERLELPVPHIPKEKYRHLFLSEICNATNVICALLVRNFNVREYHVITHADPLMGTVDIGMKIDSAFPALTALSKVPLDVLQGAREVFRCAMERIRTDAALKHEVQNILEGLRSTERSLWRDTVLMPYRKKITERVSEIMREVFSDYER